MGLIAGKFKKKGVFLETFGCQMNESDSARLLGFLSQSGYERVSRAIYADLIILNTCSVRDKAEQKVYSALGRFKTLKDTNPSLIIALSGCVAQQEGARLLQRLPYLDLVIGTANIHKICELLDEVSIPNKRLAATSLNGIIEKNEYSSLAHSPGSLKALVSIMRGCNNYCSYCIVPYTRGVEVSRDAEAILSEIRVLSDAGTREVMLIGQNVNSYRDRRSGMNFTELLLEIARIDAIKRIRFVTSHPRDLSAELIEAFGREKKLCRHLHLPVQSGSDQILQLMRRGYTAGEYLEKVKKIQALYGDMALTTDIIVGFPGESQADFEATIDLVRRVRYDNIFSFKYSPRPGTKAAGYDGQVSEDEKKARLAALQKLQREITAARGLALVGATEEVLVEGPSKLNAHELCGRTAGNRVVNFPSLAERSKIVKAGELVDVLIVEAYQNSLRGIIKNGEAYAP